MQFSDHHRMLADSAISTPTPARYTGPQLVLPSLDSNLHCQLHRPVMPCLTLQVLDLQSTDSCPG